ncbi:MAG: metallophosphoesterase [Bacteroidetes bacterium]|nr:metallophosphoesterase [Bacteroidota bacterium]
MERKQFLKALGLIGAGSILPGQIKANRIDLPVKPDKQRVLRIAHITDIHIADHKAASKGFAKCLHSIQNMEDAPDFIINGGDAIEDALFRTKPDVNKQWALWHAILKNECSLKIKNTLGNHDIWGLYTEKKDFLYGKKFAQEKLHLDKTYYSFDANGWHFIFLDSTQKKSNGLWYTAKLGAEQMEWLENDLASIAPSTPVLVVSHIPILCANVFLDDVKQRFGKFQIPGSWMHNDVKEIVALFNKYKNVKLCVSEHIHLQDKVEYNGITFCCNGAVSGDWWKNEYYHETRAGYAVIDLFNDGSFLNIYVSY